MKLSFETLRAANVKRGAQWDGKPATLDDLSFRAMELGGETGEALNFCKKLVRHLSGRAGGMPLDEARPAIAKELADVVICVDRVAEVIDIDLPTAITEKFNETSRKHGFERIQVIEHEGDQLAVTLAAYKKQHGTEALKAFLRGYLGCVLY